MDDDGDDRWTNFENHDKNSVLGKKAQEEKMPDLGDYLKIVLAQKSPRDRQERKYKVALKLVKVVTMVAYSLSSEWKMYIEADNQTGVHTAPLRTLSEDVYDCLVPIKRPSRLDGLKVVPRPNDELPQYRCQIQVNSRLSREEQQLVYNEWETCLYKQNLKPSLVLRWFNTGLDKACSVIVSKHHNVDALTFTLGADQTAVLRATISDFDEEEGLIIDTFTVNILPCYTVDAIPTSLKLAAPLPCFGTYIEGQKIFRQLVRKDVEEGHHVILLTPKAELSTEQVQGLPKEDLSWKLNLSFTEYHVYSIIDKYCRGLNFRHVLVLFNILREENKDTYGIINNEILVNALFNVSQKHIDNIRKTSDLVFKVIQALTDGLASGFMPSFHLPRMNLLTCYGIKNEERLKAVYYLQQLIKDIEKDAKNIFRHTGFEKDSENEKLVEQIQMERENEEKERNTEIQSLAGNGRRSVVPSKTGSKKGNSDNGSEKYAHTSR